MVKKGPDSSKKLDKNLDWETSRESLVSKGEEYPSPHKTTVSLGDNVEYFGDMPVHPVKDDGKAGSSLERKLQTRISFSRKQKDPSNTPVAHNLSQTLPPLSRRKPRQQLQKEKAAAITIQSAWRGCQVRREMDKMIKAATKIQSTFRGHKTRKELPLSLCNYGRRKSKKTHDRKESGSVPEFLGCYQQLDSIGIHANSQNILPDNNKPRNCLTAIDDYLLLSPEVNFLEPEMGRNLRKGMLMGSSLNILAPEIKWKRYHNAAIIIQTAWRGYRVRKMIGIIIQTEKSQSKSFSLNFICEEILRKNAILGQPSRFRVRRPDNVLLGFVPRIRNINVYTVVKGMPASQIPNISVRVLSPNAVIQGFQREKSTGAQGLYTVKSPGSLRSSQVFVCVDIRKELKQLSWLMTGKKKKPGEHRSKGAAIQ